MIFCLNPDCQKPQNRDSAASCQNCGSPLLLRSRYRPLKMIGQGGFGRTYLAVDRDRLDTRCAIKQLLPQQLFGSRLDPTSWQKTIELFKHEAMQLSKLGEHPQIPTLFAFFEEGGRLYLVQEFVEGQTLWHELEERGAFSEQQIRQLLTQLLPILRYIHRRGVIHRDITPVNILRRDRDGKLILIDFGVAKQLTNTSLVRPGTKVGTAGYAPLEQLRSGKAYPASDIYSLGVSCIHLITSTRPDLLYDPIKGWRWKEQLARKRISISDRLTNILDKMIRDLVVDRYQSIDEVIRDFRSIALPPSKPPSRKSSHPRSSQRPDNIQTTIDLPPPARKTATPPAHPTSPIPTRALYSAHAPVNSPGWHCIHTIADHSSWVTSVALAPNGSLLASGSLDNKIRVWNLQTGQELFTVTHHRSAVNALAINPSSDLLASGSDDASVKLTHLSSGKLVHNLFAHLRDVTAVAFFPDGQTLASGSEDRTIRLWNVSTGAAIATLAGDSGIIKSIVISPNGKVIASGGLDNHIHLWNPIARKAIATLNGHNNSVTSLAMSAGGTLLASGSKDRTVRLWQLPTGKLLQTFSGHFADVNAVVFHPNGQMLISASSDKKIKVWQLSNGEVRHTLSGHMGTVDSLAIGTDGKTIVSGSCDKTVRIWRWFD
ncbi:MAG: protein kinase [Geitlerinemataceae cyanobacterium]